MARTTVTPEYIGKKPFYDYAPLAEYVKSLLAKFNSGSQVLDSKELIKSLLDFKEFIVCGRNKRVYEFFLENSFAKECTDLMKYCLEKDDMEVYSALLSVMITITDNSPEMCKALMDNDLSSLLIDHTIQICKVDSEIKLPNGITVKIMFDKLILFLDNVACKTRYQQTFRRCADISLYKKTVRPFINVKDDRTRILTLAALTYLMTEEDYFSFDHYSDIINHFIVFIKRGMKDKDRRCEGLRILEIITVLKALSNIQKIKSFMLQNQHFMCLLKDILKSKNSTEEEIEMTLGVLYNLSFRHITDNTRLDSVFRKDKYVKPFLDDRDIDIRKLAEKLMTDSKPKLQSKLFDIIYDVYLAFCKDDIEKIEKIADSLTKHHFTVYLKDQDIDDAKESIEKSRIIILGTSHSFFNNSDCHAKCNYAGDIEKPIFSLILEDKYKSEDWLKENPIFEISIDTSNDNEFRSKILAVVKEIDETFSRFGVTKVQPLTAEMKSVKIN